MIYLDVDTAITVPVNVCPLTDDTDFKTRETAIAYNAAGMDLVWNFITTAGVITQTAVTPTTAGDYDWSHIGDGMYKIEIPASGGASINNDTEGFGWFSGVCTGVLPWRGPTIGFRAAGINDKLIDSAFSATRGLAGTALPDAVSDGPGGVVISDAGGLDIDSKLANTNEVTAARMGALTDWLDGGRLDLLLDTLLSRLSAARAGYLDNLNTGGLVASQSDVQGITQAQRVRVLPPPQMERPDSGSTSFRIWIYAYNSQHEAEDLDSNPTVTIENNTGTDRSANLGTVTKPGATTGQYYVDYTVADDHAIESLIVKVVATEGGQAVGFAQPTHVVDTTAVDFTSADRSKLDAIHGKIPSKPYLTGSDSADGSGYATATELAKVPKSDGSASWNETAAAQIQTKATDALNEYDPPTKAEMDARTIVSANYATALALSTVSTNVVTLMNRMGSFAGSGVNTVLGMFKALLSKGASTPSDVGGTFDASTDSVEAIRDRGDTAWPTATGFSTHSAADVAAAVMAGGDVDGFSLEQAQKLLLAAAAGQLAGAGTTEITILAADGSKIRITASVDEDGNRTALTLDASG